MKQNYYIADRKQQLEQIPLETVVRHLESDFKGTGPSDLRSFDEARAFYDMVLANAGDVCANFIAQRAAAVDEKGASFNDGDVQWAPETKENMDALTQAGLLCGTLPRKYGGLNLPSTINTAIVEMVSQADASLMNIFGLQDIAVTINKFGSAEQKDRVLPKFTSGVVTGSMALTEPEAGSDLQAVNLRAIEKDGQWYLDGVKRFITNGCGEVSLVLARSEANIKDARGLSMFLYEREKGMVIRRIEDKLGIHGSPTCELQFTQAPAELVGKRKFGLIKYVMSLMDGARLGVSAQALGIAQASLDEAVKYANEREQFGKKIVEIPAVYQMLRNMQVEVETTRTLLYMTAHAVDILEMYEARAEAGENVRSELKNASARAALLTPLSKFTATEMANRAAYDSLQVHGGCGYMKDFRVERLFRDARITNIYEGTTQLQVVAAMGGIITGLLKSDWETLKALQTPDLVTEKDLVIGFTELFDKSVELVKSSQDKDFVDYVAGWLVEMASITLRSALYLPLAQRCAEKRELFRYFCCESSTRLEYLGNRITSFKKSYEGNLSSIVTPYRL